MFTGWVFLSGWDFYQDTHPKFGHYMSCGLIHVKWVSC